MYPLGQFENNSVAMRTIFWVMAAGRVSPARLGGQVMLKKLLDGQAVININPDEVGVLERRRGPGARVHGSTDKGVTLQNPVPEAV